MDARDWGNVPNLTLVHKKCLKPSTKRKARNLQLTATRLGWSHWNPCSRSIEAPEYGPGWRFKMLMRNELQGVTVRTSRQKSSYANKP